jgi:hypothetical protein
VIDGSLRAVIRDARTVDYLIEKDPFEAVVWLRKTLGNPDPLTEEERDAVISYFQQKVPSITRWSTPCFSVECGRQKPLHSRGATLISAAARSLSQKAFTSEKKRAPRLKAANE